MHSVAVAGSGVLGAQIAFQCAYRGFNVSVYDFSSEALAKLPEKWRPAGRHLSEGSRRHGGSRPVRHR